jgi:hypothetical protein
MDTTTNSDDFERYYLQSMYLNDSLNNDPLIPNPGFGFPPDHYDSVNEAVDNLFLSVGYFFKGLAIAYFALALSCTTVPISSISPFASKDALLPKKSCLEVTLIEEENKNKDSKDKLKNLVGNHNKQYFINHKNCD